MQRNIYIKINGEWKKWQGSLKEAREYIKKLKDKKHKEMHQGIGLGL